MWNVRLRSGLFRISCTGTAVLVRSKLRTQAEPVIEVRSTVPVNAVKVGEGRMLVGMGGPRSRHHQFARYDFYYFTSVFH